MAAQQGKLWVGPSSSSWTTDALLGGVAAAGTLGWLQLFGLSDTFILGVGALSALYFAAVFHVSRRAPFFATPRPRAWVLTLACAAPLAPFGCARVASMAARGVLLEPSAHFTSDPSSRAATALFIAFLMSDTAFGATHYPTQFELVAGWLHHAVYLVFFALCLRWDMTAAVACTFPLEATTILLAVGHLRPEWRCDWLFGASFLALRLVYHAFMLWFYARMHEPPVTIWPFMAAVLALHVHWFVLWARGMVRRRSGQRTVGRAQATDSTKGE